MPLEWITPTACHSECGHTSTYVCANAIDGDTGTFWLHSGSEAHWLVFDLGETRPLTKVRLYQHGNVTYRFGHDAGVDVYVSDDPESWGDAVWSGLLNAAGWQESGAFEKSGRYVKIIEKGSYSITALYEFQVGVSIVDKQVSDAGVGAESVQKISVLGPVGDAAVGSDLTHVFVHRLVTPEGTAYEGYWAQKADRCLHQTPNGNRYAFAMPNPPSTKLKLYKSADRGQTWAVPYEGDGPDTGGNVQYGSSAIDSAEIIHVVWLSVTAAKVYYCTYNTGDDTWGSREEVATGISYDDLSRVGVSIDVDTADKPHVVYVHKAAGHTYESVWYKNRVGGSWSGAEQVYGENDGEIGRLPHIVVDRSGSVHVVFQTGGAATAPLKWRGRSDGSWGSVEQITAQSSPTQFGAVSLAVDASDRACVAYMYGLHVHLAIRTEVDTWDDVSKDRPVVPESVSLGTWGTAYFVVTGKTLVEVAGTKWEDGWDDWHTLEFYGGLYKPTADPRFPTLRCGKNEPADGFVEYLMWQEGYDPSTDELLWSYDHYYSPMMDKFVGDSAVGSETVVKVVIVEGSGTLAGVGSASLAAVRVVAGAGVAAGAGSATLAAGVVRSGAGSLVGVGSATVVGERVSLGAGSLTGVGSASLVGERVSLGSGSLGGVGNAALAGQRVLLGSAVLAGVGSASLTAEEEAIGHPTMRRWGGIPGMVYTGRGTW